MSISFHHDVTEVQPFQLFVGKQKENVGNSRVQCSQYPQVISEYSNNEYIWAWMYKGKIWKLLPFWCILHYVLVYIHSILFSMLWTIIFHCCSRISTQCNGYKALHSNVFKRVCVSCAVNWIFTSEIWKKHCEKGNNTKTFQAHDILLLCVCVFVFHYF